MRVTQHHVRFSDGTVWSLPGDHPERSSLEWRLRYGDANKKDEMLAAGVVECYRELIRLPQRKRNQRVMQLREAIARATANVPAHPTTLE